MEQITTPFLQALHNTGADYSGFIVFDLIITNEDVTLSGVRVAPDVDSLHELAASDSRDWLTIMMFLKEMGGKTVAAPRPLRVIGSGLK